MRKQPVRLPVILQCSIAGQQFKLNLLLLVVFIALEYLLIHLGLWQLERADEKRNLQQQLAKQQVQPAVDISLASSNVLDYQQVTFLGQVVPELTVFVANESYQGQDGYHLLNLVKVNEQQAVWVNRGWIKALPDRRYLPEVPPLPAQWQVTGVAYYDKGEPILFEHALQQVSQHRWLMQGMSFQLLSQVKVPGNLTLLPFIIRLAPDASHGFIREWRWLSMSPEKHLAYAIQWFGLALALLILSIFVSIKNNKPKQKESDHGF
jgi:surfeit locus 1 family protein